MFRSYLIMKPWRIYLKPQERGCKNLVDRKKKQIICIKIPGQLRQDVHRNMFLFSISYGFLQKVPDFLQCFRSGILMYLIKDKIFLNLIPNFNLDLNLTNYGASCINLNHILDKLCDQLGLKLKLIFFFFTW